MPLTEEEKAGLSPEEIAAIEQEDDETTDEKDDETPPPAEPEDKNDEADNPDLTDEEKASADKAAADEAAKKEAEDKAAAEAEAEKKADDEATAAPKAAKPFFLPTVDPKELETAKASFDEAKKKFDDGEINHEEYDDAKTAYQRLQWKDESAREHNAHAREYHWQAAQDDFFSANPRFDQNETLRLAYVSTVNAMIKTPEGQSMTDAQLLEAAKSKVMKDLSLTVDDRTELKPTKSAKDKAVADAKKKNADRSKIEDGDIGKLPSSEEETDPGEFDWLERLEGEAYQQAIEKMSPDQLARYEAQV